METNYDLICQENERRFGTAIVEYGPLLLADRYSDRTHFVYELLQNAEDAIGWQLRVSSDGPRSVAFRLTSDSLTLTHMGLPFSERYVRGICNIGKGTKGQDLTSIGKHGIGFKSVYAYTQHPEVHSGKEHFVIDSFVRPRAIPPKSTAEGETLFVLPFDHPEVSPGIAHKEILDRLRSLGRQTLLFLRHITSVTWETEEGVKGHYIRDPRTGNDGMEWVTLEGIDGEEQESFKEEWLVLSKAVFHKDEPAGFVEIAFATESVENGASEHVKRIRSASESPLVVYFPTEKETHFRFLIQGPYRTTPSRDNVPKDDPWNLFLVNQTADLVADALRKLRDAGLISIGTMEAFVVDLGRYGPHSPAAMFEPIARAIVAAIRTEPFIPKYGSGYVAGESARLARSESLRRLVTSAQLSRILSSREPREWVSGDITRERTPLLRNFLEQTIGIEEMDADSFVRKLSNSFLEEEADDWIRSLYEFLLEQQAICRETWFLQKPIIRLSDNSHVTPVDDSGAPNAYLPSRDRTEFPTVKPSVCDSDGAVKLLRELGLKEPDPVDDIIRNVLTRYAKPTSVFPAEYDRDVDRIVEAFQTDSSRRREELIRHLKVTSWIPRRNAGTGEVKLAPTDKSIYLPTQKLLELFAGNSEVWLIDRSRAILQGKKCQVVLEACGAVEYLQRTPCDTDLSQQVLAEIRRRAGLYRATKHWFRDCTIDGLVSTLNQIAAATEGWQTKALRLWDSLHDAIRHFREGFLTFDYEWTYSRTKRTEKIPARFVRLLKESSWLPDQDGRPRKPTQMCFTQLPKEFRQNANATLVSLLEFKPDEIRQLAEKAGIDAAILEIIREQGLSPEKLRKLLGIGGKGDSGNDRKRSDKEGVGQSPPGSNNNANEAQTDGSSGGATENECYGDTLSADHDGDGTRRSESESGDKRVDENENVGSQNNGGNSSSRGSRSSERGDDQATPDSNTEGGGIEDSGKRSRGHSALDRDAIIDRLRRQLELMTSTGVSPGEVEGAEESQSSRSFQSDAKFREAVMRYEREHKRIPKLKEDAEEGHDIDSFVREKGTLGRKLIRRIEVKGKGVSWTSAEIVEMSARQFHDAFNLVVESESNLAQGFDYWLYVVEDDGTGKLNVLPIRNPAKRAAHYEFRAGTWRHLVEVEEESSSASGGRPSEPASADGDSHG